MYETKSPFWYTYMNRKRKVKYKFISTGEIPSTFISSTFSTSATLEYKFPSFACLVYSLNLNTFAISRLINHNFLKPWDLNNSGSPKFFLERQKGEPRDYGHTGNRNMINSLHYMSVIVVTVVISLSRRARPRRPRCNTHATAVV